MIDGKGGTLLIVEDDGGIAALQKLRLQRAGYKVIVAGTAQEAMQKVADNAIELIVLDFLLPDRNGIEFFEQLKAAGHDLPVIVVTALTDQATKIKALTAGVRDFVVKTLEYLDYLPVAVERVLVQVRTERQLAESQSRYSSIIESAKDAILTVEADGRITLFNSAAEQMFRCPAAEAIGQLISRFMPKEFSMVPKAGAASRQFPADESLSLNVRSQICGFRANGELFPLEASVSRAEVAGHKFYTIVVRDITERERAEEQIREQAALLDKAKDAIMVRDMEDRILYWNQSAQRLYGWTAEEAIGRKTTELFHRSTPPKEEELFKTLLTKGEGSGEFLDVTKEGKEVVVESRWTLVRDKEGRPKSKLVINTDVTQKKQQEAQILRAQRMESIGTLAGGIAHDLNNVLTPVLMAADLLKRKSPDSETRAMLDIIHVSAQRGAELVKQVLYFARGTQGRREEFTLYPLLNEIGKLLKQTFPKSIEVLVSAPKTLWLVSGDPTQLHQVLINLCVNARDAMPEGGQLTIQAANAVLDKNDARIQLDAKPGPYVRLQVIDTGTGIPPDIMNKIFDPFFTTKELGKGTGLGLSTALGIVKSHGGFINAYSEVGKGAKFSVYLPALESSQTRQAAEQQADLPVGHGELILVVDDEASIRAIAKATLEARGYRVLTGEDGAEAVALFREHRDKIQVVLTDMMMPKMDGRATIRALQELDPRVRIIAASGLAVNGQAGPQPVNGVRAVLAKPFTADKLLETIHQVLETTGA
jgi:PAS domain S-box-containing protein